LRSAAAATRPSGATATITAWWCGSIVRTAAILATASCAASSGDAPRRMHSTARNAPHALEISSPVPVAVAAPADGSTYSPCPTIGESPTRPGTL
jgi:hypothetical protein